MPAGNNLTALVRVADALGADTRAQRSGLRVNRTANATLVMTSVKTLANLTTSVRGSRADELVSAVRDASVMLSPGRGASNTTVVANAMLLAKSVMEAVKASVDHVENAQRAEALAASLVPLSTLAAPGKETENGGAEHAGKPGSSDRHAGERANDQINHA
jgi:hypothetical protein